MEVIILSSSLFFFLFFVFKESEEETAGETSFYLSDDEVSGAGGGGGGGGEGGEKKKKKKKRGKKALESPKMNVVTVFTGLLSRLKKIREENIVKRELEVCAEVTRFSLMLSPSSVSRFACAACLVACFPLLAFRTQTLVLSQRPITYVPILGCSEARCEGAFFLFSCEGAKTFCCTKCRQAGVGGKEMLG